MKRQTRHSGTSKRRLWRPRDLAPATVGQVRDMARARCGNAGFDWRVWFFAGADAVKKVLHVVDRAVAKTVGLHNWILPARHAFVINAEAAPVELQRCLSASELKAAVVDRRG